MRILYLCFDPGIELFGPAGGSIHIRSMVRAFAELGHQVAVLATSRGSGKQELPAMVHIAPVGRANRILARTMRKANAVIGRLGREHPDAVRILHNAAFARAAASVAREFRPEAIYERYSMWGVTGAWLSRRRKIPLILEVNAPLVYEQRQYRGLTLPSVARRVEDAIWRAADRIEAVSSPLIPHLERAGVRPERVVMAPNAVERMFFEGDGTDIRSELGLRNQFVIGFSGTFKTWHGVESLMRAFARFRLESPGHLLLVGDGPLRTSLEEQAANLGIRGDVTFAGATEHSRMPGYLRAMDVAVAPYPPLDEFYFSPLKIFEYLAAGTAVVASRAGQIADVIQDGKNGLLYEAGDEDGLLDCLRRAATSAELRIQLGRNGVESVRDCTWVRNARLALEPFDQTSKPLAGAAKREARFV